MISRIFDALIQQTLIWEGDIVFILSLAFGLTVVLGYAIISAARYKRDIDSRKKEIA